MKNSILKNASMMILLSLTSKFLGFIRDYMVAIKFGTTMEADAFLMASNIPNILFVIIGVAITTTFIPIYNEIKEKNNKEELRYFYNNVINILLIISFIITLISEVFTPILVKIVAPGFIGDKYQLTILLTRILSSVIILNTIIYIFIAILQCEGNFIVPASIGIPYNSLLITYYIFFSDKFGVVGISVVVSIALILQVLILYKYLQNIDFKYMFIMNYKDKNLKRILILLLPICVGTGMEQLNGVFNGILSSSLDSGSVAALNYALKLNMLISDIIIGSIVTVIYQNMTKMVAKHNNDIISNEVNASILIMFIILIPIVLITFIYGEFMVKVLFERGAFNSDSTSATAGAFRYYSIGLFAIAINSLLTRVSYSIKNTKIPMYSTFIGILTNIILGIILRNIYGIVGIAIASTVGGIVSCITIGYILKRKINGIIDKKLLINIFKLLCSLIPGIYLLRISYYIIVIGSSNIIVSSFILLIVSIITIIIYIFLSYKLKVKEVREIIEYLDRMCKKLIKDIKGKIKKWYRLKL